MGTRLPVQRLIEEEIFAARPDFEPFKGNRPYVGRRTRRIGGETFFDFIELASSQRVHVFDASVATGLFPTTTGALFTHDVRAAARLGALCGRDSAMDRLWEYDGSEGGAREALQRISRDLADVAEPWFDERTRSALEHPLVRLGLEWIRAHPAARTGSRTHDRDELSRVLRRRAFELQLEPRVKKEIATLTNDLLDFASIDGAS